jgi:hypothetical protein
MSQAITPEPASARGGSSVRLIHGASPEQWQFFAFVFAALAMLVTALLDALPPWNSIIPRGSEWAKVIGITALGYFTLWHRPTKRFLVRVLATIKPLDIR